MKLKRKALKIAGIVLLAVLILFSAVSLIVVQVMLGDNFPRTARPEYSTHFYYEDVADRYEREAVSFLSGKNRLYGHLYGVGNPSGLVVISHGLGGGEESYMAEALSFVDRGYQVLCYSNTGCWDSEGKGCVGLSQSVLDLDAALDWVEGESRFDGVPVFLYGHSWGGYAVAAVLRFDHNVTASVSVAGFNDPMSMILEWVGTIGYVEYPFIWLNQKITFGDTFGLTAVDAINSTDVPVLVIHGTGDPIVGYDTVGIIAAREKITNPNVQYLIRSGEQQNGHNSLCYSLDCLEYVDVLNQEYDALYEKYDGEIPDHEEAAFFAAVDKFRASQMDPAFMDAVVDFYREAAGEQK